MLVHGVRGELLTDMMDQDELEVYGIDWEALQEDDIRQSQLNNNGIQEGGSSWIGNVGPPADLNEVLVLSPKFSFQCRRCRADDTSLSAAMVGAGG